MPLLLLSTEQSALPAWLAGCCSIQAIGISIWATAKSDDEGDPNDVKLGSEIMLAGLAFQVGAA